MKRLVFMLAGLTLAAGAAHAQDAPPAPPIPSVVTNVQWETRPALQADDYPPIPLALRISGSATLRCVAADDGAVRGCEVIEEDGLLGFGESAIRVVQRGRITPQTVDGIAQNAAFTVRIPFEMWPEPGVPPYEGEEPSPEFLARVRAMVEERFIAGYVIEEMIGWMTPQDRARVEIHFVRALRDKGSLWRDAMALGLARIAPPEVVAAIEAGRPPPAVPGHIDVSAMDRLAAADEQIRARAREYFCAQHACPAQD